MIGLEEIMDYCEKCSLNVSLINFNDRNKMSHKSKLRNVLVANDNAALKWEFFKYFQSHTSQDNLSTRSIRKIRLIVMIHNSEMMIASNLFINLNLLWAHIHNQNYLIIEVQLKIAKIYFEHCRWKSSKAQKLLNINKIFILYLIYKIAQLWLQRSLLWF